MDVLRLFTVTNPELVVNEHNKLFPHDMVTLTYYANYFLTRLRNKVAVPIQHVVEISEFSVVYDDPSFNEKCFDVSIVVDGTSFAMSLTPWSIIAVCEVVCNTPEELSLVQQAAYIFSEMSIHGGEEESDTVRDIIEDSVNSIASGETDKLKLKTIHDEKQDIWDSLFPDYTEEEREKLRQESLQDIEREKTAKFFKNGVPYDRNIFNGKPVFEI